MDSYEQVLKKVEARMGANTRISTVREFFSLKGRQVWLVYSPIATDERGNDIYFGSSTIQPWVVGDFVNSKGQFISSSRNLPHNNNYPKKQIFNIHVEKEYFVNDKKYCVIINLLDYNIFPNIITNNAIFKTKEEATYYRMWLKLKYPTHPLLETLDPRVINGRKVNLEEVKKSGIQYFLN